MIWKKLKEIGQRDRPISSTYNDVIETTRGVIIMNYYTILEMTSILNQAGCGYDKKTIGNWINSFNTKKHHDKYGEPRRREFGNQNKKPIEYPQMWFGAVIDEHDTDIHDRIFEYVQVNGAQYGDNDKDPQDLVDYDIFMEQNSLSGMQERQMEADQLFEDERQYNDILKAVIVAALHIDTSHLYNDVQDNKVSDNLLDYVNYPEREGD